MAHVCAKLAGPIQIPPLIALSVKMDTRWSEIPVKVDFFFFLFSFFLHFKSFINDLNPSFIQSANRRVQPVAELRKTIAFPVLSHLLMIHKFEFMSLSKN